MKIKEVEERLGISRTHIRYLQRVEIFEPKAYNNKYRNFTEDDIQNLEMSLILMKAGVSARDVGRLWDEKETLDAVLCRTEAVMKERAEEILGSLELIQDIRASNFTFDTLPRDVFWEDIRRKEKNGKKFMGSYKLKDVSDSVEPAVYTERIITCPHCGGKNRIDLEEFIYDDSYIDRPMGQEVQRSFDSEEALVCVSCGKVFRISGVVCEYPVGTLETEEIVVDKK